MNEPISKAWRAVVYDRTTDERYSKVVGFNDPISLDTFRQRLRETWPVLEILEVEMHNPKRFFEVNL